MITGVHTMFYSSQPEELRAFLRDKLGFTYTDVGEGWLIFDLPEAEMGCHPANAADGAPSGMNHISFYCDDIQRTIAELRGRGVEFADEVADLGYGLVTHFRMPGDFKVQLYQPRYVKRSATQATQATDQEPKKPRKIRARTTRAKKTAKKSKSRPRKRLARRR